MGCKCAKYNYSEGRYKCDVSGDGCMYMLPNSKKCAEEYGEGPDAYPDEKCENCNSFYLEDGKRCCKDEQPQIFVGSELVRTKYIEDDMMSCGCFKNKIS